MTLTVSVILIASEKMKKDFCKDEVVQQKFIAACTKGPAGGMREMVEEAGMLGTIIQDLPVLCYLHLFNVTTSYHAQECMYVSESVVDDRYTHAYTHACTHTSSLYLHKRTLLLMVKQNLDLLYHLHYNLQRLAVWLC